MLMAWACCARRGRLAAQLAAAALLLLLLLLLAARSLRPATPAPFTRSSIASTALLVAANTTTAAPTTSTPGAMLTRPLYAAGFSRPHGELCPAGGAGLRLVILVASAPGRAAARRAVRLTWGHAAQRRDLALAFVLGAPPPALRRALDEEDALYGDLVEGRFRDSRSTLTLKSVSMLEWKVAYCPRAPFLLKADDDVFVNVERLLRFAAAPARARARDAVWGSMRRFARARPGRRARGGPAAPASVLDPAYLVSAGAARRLARAAGHERYPRREKEFVTGPLAARRGVRRVHARGFLRQQAAQNPCEVQRWLAVHLGGYREQFELWRNSLDGKYKCHVPPPV